MVVTLLGASGYTGRLVAAALDRRDVEFVAAGRDEHRVRDAVARLPTATEVRTVDATDHESLRALCRETDVLLTTVGPFLELGKPVLGAAVAEGCHYLDTTGEQAFVRWAFDAQGDAAAAAGVVCVPAFGLEFVVGDLLADLAAVELDEVAEVHVAYAVRGAGMAASRGTRATIAALLGREGGKGVAVREGRLVEEGFGEARRLAWFPRPIGPRHAAGIPGAEPILVPRHVAGVAEVGTYLALPGVLTDLGQVAARAAAVEPVQRVLGRLLRLGPEGPSESRRERTRWACVAEAVAPRPDDATADAQPAVARAWAHGRDVYGLTGEIVALGAARLVREAPRVTGVVAPAEAFDAAGFLDELADAAGVVWSVEGGPGS